MNNSNANIEIYTFNGELVFNGPIEEADEFAKGDVICTDEEGRFWIGFSNGFMSFATWATLEEALAHANRDIF